MKQRRLRGTVDIGRRRGPYPLLRAPAARHKDRRSGAADPDGELHGPTPTSTVAVESEGIRGVHRAPHLAQPRGPVSQRAPRNSGYSLYDSLCRRQRGVLPRRACAPSSICGRASPAAGSAPAATSPWQFNADMHIVAWLEAMGHDYDVITDDDLDAEGLAADRDHYRTVMTGTHPEYYSSRMRDAVDAYLGQGGRLMYMGGNGFYWRIAYHDELPGVLELRRAEVGSPRLRSPPRRASTTTASTGEFGGIWRRVGRSPQIRWSASAWRSQGFDICGYYKRMSGSHDAQGGVHLRRRRRRGHRRFRRRRGRRRGPRARPLRLRPGIAAAHASARHLGGSHEHSTCLTVGGLSTAMVARPRRPWRTPTRAATWCSSRRRAAAGYSRPAPSPGPAA